MLFPGDIITIKSCDIDLNNRVLLHDCNGKSYILAGRHPNAFKIKKDIEQKINKKGYEPAVCIPGNSVDGFPLVLMENYNDSLINQFYKKRGRKVPPFPFAHHKNVWEKRWTQAGNDWENIRCQRIESSIHGHPREFSWAESVYYGAGGTVPCWVMPVFLSFAAEFDSPNEILFSPQDPFMNLGYPQPCCYVALDGFPREIRAQIITGNGSEPSALRIVLHGFLRPDTAHYKFWTHVVCGNERAKEITKKNNGVRERSYWEGILDQGIPQENLFKNCRPHPRSETCDCPSREHFEEIHGKILDSFNSYLEKVITFLGKAKTIGLMAAQYPNGIAPVNVNAIKEECVNGRKWFPSLALAGMCYNWNDSEPILHLYVKTFFRGHKNRLWGQDNYKFKDKHEQAGFREFRIEIN
jgi:hypothetical protein